MKTENTAQRSREKNVWKSNLPIFYLWQRETAADLGYDAISHPVAFLNQVARVGLAAQAGHPRDVTAALVAPELALLDLDPALSARYASAIIDAAAAAERTIPSHTELQDLVDGVNQECAEDVRRIEAVERVNAAVEAGGGEGGGLCEALAALGLRLSRSDERRCLEELLSIRANRLGTRTDIKLPIWMEGYVINLEKFLVSYLQSYTFCL